MKYADTYAMLEKMCSKIADDGLRRLFSNCFLSTLTTTVKEEEDGSCYVFTGDIPAMWLRDSSAQLIPYVRMCKTDGDMRDMLRRVIKRQFTYINIDPYANAFNEFPDGSGHRDDVSQNSWVWERKFELDSLCFPIWLCRKYYETTSDESIFDGEFVKTTDIIYGVFRTEQDHFAKSEYTFRRTGMYSFDTLDNDGRGGDCLRNGLVWSAFRPSDDKNEFAYNIPENMFVAATAEFLCDVFRHNLRDAKRAEMWKNLSVEIKCGLNECAFIDVNGAKIYAYETDGLGRYCAVDDANMPSLLSLPYLECCSFDDEIYRATRSHLLSLQNRYYYKGKYACGIGSPHTPDEHIWPLGLIIQGLTSTDDDEKLNILQMLGTTHAGTYLMHESFHKDNPEVYTREWFGWANSMFAEYFMQNFDLFCNYLIK